ncbi:MAG: flagellar biosynthetic protein FliO [Sphingopyxis sp.]
MFGVMLNMLVMLLLVGALAYGSLWTWKKAQSGSFSGRFARFAPRPQRLRVQSQLQLGLHNRLVAIEYDGRSLLIAASRSGISLISGGDIATLSESEKPDFQQIYADGCAKIPSTAKTPVKRRAAAPRQRGAKP